MAGEVEDTNNFEADCLPSGSISFGRFEEESLSWERRSTFSHNRYLEEVKKYSRPGSVIEKKAYFEAHFKRKALSREASSECQNDNEDQTTENGDDEVKYMINENHGDEETCYLHDDMNYMADENHGNEESYYVQYDETPPSGSDEHEYELIDIEREEGLPWEFQEDQVVAKADAVLDSIREILQNTSGYGMPLDHGDTKVDVEQNPDAVKLLQEKEKQIAITDKSKTEVKIDLANETENADGIHERTEPSLKNPEDVIDHTPSTKKQQKASPNAKSRMERTTINTKGNARLSSAQCSRKMSNEKASPSSSKVSDKASRKTEKESSLRSKTERQSPLKAAPISYSIHTSSKPQDSENKETVNDENKSRKDLKTRKPSSKPRLAIDKSYPDRSESISRPKCLTSSRKLDAKLKSGAFSFRSEERAEKRKEFHMKLEEKQHAKEAEINQIQARTQEETEAEIKQLRRSLNFKATPMPSFYHEAAPRSSDVRKAPSNHSRSPKTNSKSTSLGKKESLSAQEQRIQEVTESLAPNGTKASSQTLSNGSSKIDEIESSQACKKTQAGKKEREKGKINCTIKDRQGGKRDQVTTSGSNMGKKTMKGIIGRCSEVGHVTVHVAY